MVMVMMMVMVMVMVMVMEMVMEMEIEGKLIPSHGWKEDGDHLSKCGIGEIWVQILFEKIPGKPLETDDSIFRRHKCTDIDT